MKAIIYPILAIIITLSACSKKEDLKSAQLEPMPSPAIPASIPASDFNLLVSNDTVLADGSSYSQITLKLNISYLSIYKTVEVSVSSFAQFIDGVSTKTVTLDANGEFTVFVTSISSGLCVLNAKVNNSISKQVSIYFTPSYPDQIIVNVSAGVVPSSFTTAIGVTAKLFKANGTFSIGQQVQYKDSTVSNTSVGTFINKTMSNATGESTATYALQDTSYHGYVYLKAYVQTPAGKIMNFNKIRIQ